MAEDFRFHRIEMTAAYKQAKHYAFLNRIRDLVSRNNTECETALCLPCLISNRHLILTQL